MRKASETAHNHRGTIAQPSPQRLSAGCVAGCPAPRHACVLRRGRSYFAEGPQAARARQGPDLARMARSDPPCAHGRTHKPGRRQDRAVTCAAQGNRFAFPLAGSGPCAGRLRRPALAAPPSTNDRPRRKSRARARGNCCAIVEQKRRPRLAARPPPLRFRGARGYSGSVSDQRIAKNFTVPAVDSVRTTGSVVSVTCTQALPTVHVSGSVASDELAASA